MPKPRLPTDPSAEMSTARPVDPITRKAQIDARLQALSARTGLQARKDHDRLTWILGRMVVEQMTHDPALQAWVRRDLPCHLPPAIRTVGFGRSCFPTTRRIDHEFCSRSSPLGHHCHHSRRLLAIYPMTLWVFPLFAAANILDTLGSTAEPL